MVAAAHVKFQPIHTHTHNTTLMSTESISQVRALLSDIVELFHAFHGSEEAAAEVAIGWGYDVEEIDLNTIEEIVDREALSIEVRSESGKEWH